MRGVLCGLLSLRHISSFLPHILKGRCGILLQVAAIYRMLLHFIAVGCGIGVLRCGKLRNADGVCAIIREYQSRPQPVARLPFRVSKRVSVFPFSLE